MVSLARRLCLLTIVWAISLVNAAPRSFAATFTLTYSGRLTQPNGAPVAGPVDITVKFWSAATGGNTLGSPVEFSAVTLNHGVFSLPLELNSAQALAVFQDGSEPVFIEVTAAGKTYPRQQYSYVPFALRVPVDTKSVVFDQNGNLGINGALSATSGNYLVSDGSGGVTWKSLSIGSLITQGNAGATLSPGQVLTYNGTQWLAQSPSTNNGAGSIGLVGVANGGTGLSATPTNGKLLIGNGSGYVLGNLTQGNSQGVSIINGAGSIALDTVQDIRPTAAPNFAGLTLSGTPSKILKTSGSGVVAGAVSTDITTTLGYTPLNKAGDTMTGALNVATITEPGGGTPSISGAGQGVIYFDAGSNQFKVSQNGSAYAPLVTGGSVTSISTGAGLTGGPISSSGTLSLATVGTSGTYTKVITDAYGRVTGSASLSTGDLPPIYASQITGGILPVANGGTGAASFTNNGILVGAGSLPVSTVTGSQYQVLTAGAAGTPSFGALNLAQSAAVSGVLAPANGGTGISSTATYPASGTVVTETATETLTNKTLTGATINGASTIAGSTSINTTGAASVGALSATSMTSQGNVTIQGSGGSANKLVLNDKGSTNF